MRNFYPICCYGFLNLSFARKRIWSVISVVALIDSALFPLSSYSQNIGTETTIRPIEGPVAPEFQRDPHMPSPPLDPHETTMSPKVEPVAPGLKLNSLLDLYAHCCPTCVCVGTPAPPVPIPPRQVLPPHVHPSPSPRADLPIEYLTSHLLDDNFGIVREVTSFAFQNSPYSFATTVALQYRGGAISCSGVLVSKT